MLRESTCETKRKEKRNNQSVIVTGALTVSYCNHHMRASRKLQRKTISEFDNMIQRRATLIYNHVRLVMTLTVPLELFIPFMLIFVTNLTVGAASGYLDPHSTFRLYILFS